MVVLKFHKGPVDFVPVSITRLFFFVNLSVYSGIIYFFLSKEASRTHDKRSRRQKVITTTSIHSLIDRWNKKEWSKINFRNYVLECLWPLAPPPLSQQPSISYRNSSNITDTHTNDGLQIPLRDLEEETIRRASFPSSCPCLGIPVSVNRTTFHFGTTAARSI